MSEDLALVDMSTLRKMGYGTRHTINRKRKDGRFPEPDIYDPRPKWKLSTIRRHLEKRQTEG